MHAILFLVLFALGSVQGIEALRAKSYLNSHNFQRKHYGAKPLKLAGHDKIAATQAYANKCVFEHSGGNYGENLAAVWSGPTAPTIDFAHGAMAGWMNEKQDGSELNHFTQVVWKSTGQVACAAARCGQHTKMASDGMDAVFYVCRYFNQRGNVIGQAKKNVGRRLHKRSDAVDFPLQQRDNTTVYPEEDDLVEASAWSQVNLEDA